MPRGTAASILAVAIVLIASGCRGLDYPGRVVEPAQIGIISDVEDRPGFDVAVFGDHRVEFSVDEPHPGLTVGELMVYWGDADPAFFTFPPSARDLPGCDFHHQPRAAFNEPNTIVMIVGENDELGVRLPKAPGYEVDPTEYYDESGAFVLPPPDFCLNADGQVTLGGEVSGDIEQLHGGETSHAPAG